MVQQLFYTRDELMMMRFFTDKGKRGRPTFESEPVYFGESTW